MGNEFQHRTFNQTPCLEEEIKLYTLQPFYRDYIHPVINNLNLKLK